MVDGLHGEDSPLIRYISDNDDCHHPEQGTVKLKCLLLETIVFLFFVAHGTVIPINLYYAHECVHLHHHHINRTCESYGNHSAGMSEVQKEEQHEIAQFLMYNKIVDSCGIIPALFIGPLVDTVGRKFGVVIPVVGILAKGILFCVITALKLNMYFLLIGTVIENVTGGFSVILLSCYGIVADITPPGQERTFRIAVIDALQAISTSVSVVLASYWIQNKDFRDPVIFSLAFSISLLILVTTLLPETLEKTTGSKCSPGLFLRCFAVYRNSRFFPRRKSMMIVALICFILTVSVNFSKSSIQQLVLLYSPFCWHEVKISLYVSVGLIVSWFAILTVSKILQTVFHLQDLSLGILGCISSVASLLIFALASTDDVAYGAAAAGTFVRLVIPMIRSFTSRHVAIREQGALFAGLAGIEVLTAALAGSLADYVYSLTATIDRGIVFYCMGVFMLITLSLFILLKIKSKDEVSNGFQRPPEDECPYDRIN